MISKNVRKNNIVQEEKLINSSVGWKGKNYFYLDGFILAGPSNFKPFLMTASFIIIIPFFVFGIQDWKWYNDHDYHSIPILFTIFSLLLLTQIILTTFCNPGILPRLKTYPGKPHKTAIKCVLKGTIKFFKLCETCQIIKPPRSNHCQDCDNCVEKFDHHCPWIGQCVAVRNYRRFYVFVLLANFNSIFILSVSIFKLDKVIYSYKDKVKNSYQHALAENIGSLYIIIYQLLQMLFLISLLGYHTYLILSNKTTRETIKKLFNTPFGNVYDLSNYLNYNRFSNCFAALFCPKSYPERITAEVRKEVVGNEAIRPEFMNLHIGGEDEEKLKFRREMDSIVEEYIKNNEESNDNEKRNAEIKKSELYQEEKGGNNRNLSESANSDQMSKLDLEVQDSPRLKGINAGNTNSIETTFKLKPKYNHNSEFDRLSTKNQETKIKYFLSENSSNKQRKENYRISNISDNYHTVSREVVMVGRENQSRKSDKHYSTDIIYNNIYSNVRNIDNSNFSDASLGMKIVDDSSIDMDAKIHKTKINGFYHEK